LNILCLLRFLAVIILLLHTA